VTRIVVLERRLVAELLAKGGSIDVSALLDHDLAMVAIAELASRAWRSLVTSSLEDLVRALGGDAGDVERLRREAAR
jgi:hypothetical protein